MVAGKKGSFCGPGANLTIYNSYLAKNLVFSEGLMKAPAVGAGDVAVFPSPSSGNKFCRNLSKLLVRCVTRNRKGTARDVISASLSFSSPLLFYLAERPFFLQNLKEGIMLDSSYRFGYSR
jgi:hypothetical protein